METARPAIKLMLLTITMCVAAMAQVPRPDTLVKYHISKIVVYSDPRDTADSPSREVWFNNTGHISRETSFWTRQDSTGAHRDSSVSLYDDNGRIIHETYYFMGKTSTVEEVWIDDDTYKQHSRPADAPPSDIIVHNARRIRPHREVYKEYHDGKLHKKQVLHGHGKTWHGRFKSHYSRSYTTEHFDDSHHLTKALTHSYTRHWWRRSVHGSRHGPARRKHTYIDTYTRDERGFVIKHISFSSVDQKTTIYHYEYLAK